MTIDNSQLYTDITAQRGRLAEFRTQVRDEVISQYLSGPWCLEGTQQVLHDLALPPIAMSFKGTATMRLSITGVKDAASLGEAEARVIAALSAVCADAGITWTLDEVDPHLNGAPVDNRSETIPVSRSGQGDSSD
ncbi:MAG TPA: hypothetical protein VFG15_03290 [Amycolatopsis sp.]|nr:hypothetical protein [Amycolatopsis sp.]